MLRPPAPTHGAEVATHCCPFRSEANGSSKDPCQLGKVASCCGSGDRRDSETQRKLLENGRLSLLQALIDPADRQSVKHIETELAWATKTYTGLVDAVLLDARLPMRGR